MTIAIRAAALASALLLLAPGVARAAGSVDGIDVDNFEPALDPHGYLTVNGARSLGFLETHLRALASVATEPLAFGSPTQPAGSRTVVRRLTKVDLVAAVGVFPIGYAGGLQIGADLPVILEEEGRRLDDRTADLDGQGLGQLRTEAKLTLLSSEPGDAPLGLAICGFGEWSTARDRDLLSADRGNSFGGTLVLEKRLGPLRGALEVGYHWIDGKAELFGLTFDDKLLVSAAAAFELTDSISVFAEVSHWTRAAEPYDSERESPFEADAGVRYLGPKLLLELGGGAGLNKGIGAPDARVFGGAGITF